jgi:hypothetical protein
MTLEEARHLMWFANTHYKPFIERTDIYPDGNYLLVVEPVEGEQQIFTDAEKAHLALLEGAFKSSRSARELPPRPVPCLTD